MSDERRFFVFLILSVVIFLTVPQVMHLIWGPPPRAVPAGPADPAKDAAQVADAAKPADAAKAKVGDEPGQPAEDAPAPAKPVELTTREIGSTEPSTGFKMQVALSNRGAVVRSIALADFKNEDRTGPNAIVSPQDEQDVSFALGLKGLARRLEETNWEIVDVAPEPGNEPAAADEVQAVRFRTSIPERRLTVTKTFSLKKGSYTLDLAVEVRNDGREPTEVTYRLGGPRGFVLEGEWYSRKLRDVAIGGGSRGSLSRQTIHPTTLFKEAQARYKTFSKLAASGPITPNPSVVDPDVFERFDGDGDGRLAEADYRAAANYLAGDEYRWTAKPLRFAGVEGQYFGVFLILPPDTEPRWDASTSPLFVRLYKDTAGREHRDRSDVSVEIESQPLTVGPQTTLAHTFTIYAGPRDEEPLYAALQDPALVESLLYESNWFLFFPRSLVTLVSGIMLSVLKFYHGWVHNWGIAIFMLTVTVRLLMFPLSRRQTINAMQMQQKMAAYKPELERLKEKYKNDSQELARANMELMRKHGINPIKQLGCLPVLLQMPVFIGLWQGLSSSIDLRQAEFVSWIDNLAAPDALFAWGENIPLISYFLGPHFNLLPTVLIALFLVQQKLFMPPKTDPPDPQMEMQQKVMTMTMVIFGVIFWRLPSGLCVYYIASTAWGIAERKLLGRLQKSVVATPPAESEAKPSILRKLLGAAAADGKTTKPGKRRASSEGNGTTLADRINALIKKASKK